MASRDPYAVVLADLRAKRDEIDNLIRSLEAFRPGTTTTAPVMPAEPPSLPEHPSSSSGMVRGSLFGLSIVDAAKAVLKQNGHPMKNVEIVEAIRAGGHAMNSPDPINTVSSVLNRALQQGIGIVRVGRGVWQIQKAEAEQPAGRLLEDEADNSLFDASDETRDGSER